MKIASVLALSLALGSFACAASGPDSSEEGLQEDAIRVGAPKQSERVENEVSPLRHPACSTSQLQVANNHCAANHPGYHVTGCEYDAANGYVIYTYAANNNFEIMPSPFMFF